MKYKVGDKVRVKSDLSCDIYAVVSDMLRYKDKIFTIVEVSADGHYYKVNGNDWAWSDEMLEPAYADGGFCNGFIGGKIPTPSKPVPIEEQIGLPKAISIHDLPTNELIVPWNMIPNIHIEADMSMAELSQKLSEHFNTLPKQRTCGKRAENIYFDENVFKEEKVMKFTFNTTEGYRIDNSNNTKIPTITTEVFYKDKDGCAKGGSATCDKTDYNERQGVIEALANMCCDGNFDREYNKAVKWNKTQDLRNRTCRYCGQVFDTYQERIKHMDWHVECRKARHERYRLRKRAKEIAFEEAAQKMAKEIAKEN